MMSANVSQWPAHACAQARSMLPRTAGIAVASRVPQHRLSRKLRATEDAVEIHASTPHQIEQGSVDAAATVAHIPDQAPPAQLAQQATLQQPAAPPTLQERIMSNRLLAGSVAAGPAFLGGTFLIAVVRVLRKYNSPKERRKRTVDKNKRVVESLNALMVEGRQALTPGSLQRIRSATGFSSVEVFRKYLWYLLKERPFNPDAVADMVALKQALALGDAEVAEALSERAQRIYDKYGNVMLETVGMSKAGVERKATCRALFSKMLYLAECEELLKQGAEAKADIPGIFGATEDDTAKLRIASLYEIDFGKLEDMPTADGPDD